MRANRSTDSPASRFPLGPGDAYVPGNLFAASNQPLIAYLRFAYKLGQGDLLNLPGWVYSDGFDIEARAQGSPTKDRMRLMMRALLADRFGVLTHLEARTKPVFELTLSSSGKTGPMLLPSPSEGCASNQTPDPRLRVPEIPCGSLGPVSGTNPNTGRLAGRGITLKQIADILMNPFTGLDRPVIDRTGLSGTFDFSLEWSTEPDHAPLPDQAGPQPGLD